MKTIKALLLASIMAMTSFSISEFISNYKDIGNVNT